jgi:hypothetical protein
MNYITIIAVEQDTSGTVLNEWLQAGFREVVWIYQAEPWKDNQKWLGQGSTCPTCMALDGQHFKIQDLLNEMTHDAPKYSKSHVGCKCLMKRIPREEEILDYPEETPAVEEAPKIEETPKPEEPKNI